MAPLLAAIEFLAFGSSITGLGRQLSLGQFGSGLQLVIAGVGAASGRGAALRRLRWPGAVGKPTTCCLRQGFRLSYAGSFQASDRFDGFIQPVCCSLELWLGTRSSLVMARLNENAGPSHGERSIERDLEARFVIIVSPGLFRLP